MRPPFSRSTPVYCYLVSCVQTGRHRQTVWLINEAECLNNTVRLRQRMGNEPEHTVKHEGEYSIVLVAVIGLPVHLWWLNGVCR